MATSYNFSTFNSLIYDIRDEIDDVAVLKNVSHESMRGYIIQACQRIAARLPIRQKTDLRLVLGQTQYPFADTDTPVTGTGTIGASGKDVTGVTATGTGTITTDGADVTGVGTLFLTELSIGKMVIVGTEAKMVTAIDSNLLCTLDDGFDTDLAASAFDYSTTMFTKEINVGSTIISNSISKVVEEITDGYTLTVTVAYAVAQAAQSFTVDTKVTEIPTKFYDFEKTADRLEGTVSRPVNIVSNEDLVRYRQQDYGTDSYSNFQKPHWASVWNNGTGRYLEIYPTVDVDKQITLYGFIQVNPHTYQSLALTANIPLQQEHEAAIKEFAKYRIYKRAKDKENAVESLSMFDAMVRETLVNLPVTKRIKITRT